MGMGPPLPILWPPLPDTAYQSYTSNIPQNETGTHLRLWPTNYLDAQEDVVSRPVTRLRGLGLTGLIRSTEVQKTAK